MHHFCKVVLLESKVHCFFYLSEILILFSDYNMKSAYCTQNMVTQKASETNKIKTFTVIKSLMQ